MKKKIKAIGALLLASGILASSLSAFAFSDINSENWANTAVTALSEAGYINGYEDGTFRPDANITRAEFVTIINNMKGNTIGSNKAFSDLADSSWYYESIGKGVAAGYISGYDDNTVRPDAFITRQEAAVIAYRAWNLTPKGDVSFSDSSEIGSWARAQVATLVSKKIINGYEDGTFRPSSYMTRAEVAVMINNLKIMEENIAKTTNKDPKGVISNSLIIR